MPADRATDMPASRYSPSHIGGNPAALTERQRELIALAASLGPRFAERATRHDREASFPLENFADLRAAGLLGICVPQAYGGLGADFATYVLVSAEIGRWCGATALSFNMHVCSCLWSGLIADALDMSTEQRADHERIRAQHYRRIVEQGQVYAQPFSEGGAAAAGAAPGARWRAGSMAATASAAARSSRRSPARPIGTGCCARSSAPERSAACATRCTSPCLRMRPA